jgi:hypothetical protein
VTLLHIMIDDHDVEQVIQCEQGSRPQTGAGRRWGLAAGRPGSAGRRLLPRQTNLTYRQIALLFGISKSAVDRVIDHLAPLLVLSPVMKKHSRDAVLIVDGCSCPPTTGPSRRPARTTGASSVGRSM